MTTAEWVFLISGLATAYMLCVGVMNELLRASGNDLRYGPAAVLGPLLVPFFAGAALVKWIKYRAYLRK